MAHSLENGSTVLSEKVELDTPSQARAERPVSRNPAWWALPVLPWLWYLVRSLFAFMDVVAAGLPILIIIGGAAAVAIAVGRLSLIHI